MSLVIFICPENPCLAKYCEAFYNYLTYGYRNWSSRNVTKSNSCISRILKNKNHPSKIELLANDPVFDRIYEKVITSDCYDHYYSQISDTDLAKASLVIYITDSKSPKSIPEYIFSTSKDFVLLKWKTSKIKSITSNKCLIFETLIRNMIPSK